MGDLVDVLDEGAGLHLLVVDKYERTQEELIELARERAFAFIRRISIGLPTRIL